MLPPRLLLSLLMAHIAHAQVPFVGKILKSYAQLGIPYREEQFLDNFPIDDHYDFIIIGSGPGGSVMANRLSENINWKILLLEAGIEGSIYTDIPAMSPLFAFTDYNWRYTTEPQPFMCLGMENQRCAWPSGRGLGGTTIWNGMLWTRSPAKDFDEWEALGNPGWSYNDMLNSTLKVENMTIQELKNNPFHSTNGKVSVEYPFATKLSNDFLQAGQEFGYFLVDYNDPNTPFGFSRTQITSRNGRRVNAATAYLLPIKHRTNLHIVKNAYVTKVVIDEITKTAIGVEFKKNSKTRFARATKEVIVSAGSFNTPKILMLSGVGPADHLSSMHVKLIHHSPAVGKNLQEHIAAIITVLINATDSFTVKKVAPIILPEFQQWLTSGTGLLSNNIVEAIGYIRTEPWMAKPNIEMIFAPVSLALDDGIFLRKYFGLSDELYQTTFAPINQVESFALCPMIMYPESKGEILLRSHVPSDPPVIVTNFLKEPADVKTMIDAQKLMIDFLQTPSMRKLGATPYHAPILGCESFPFGSDEYFECSVRTMTLQFHHQCCTAKMGPDPTESVVDSRLRVYGVNRLRVVDASVMPKIPGAHTMSTTYAIAEKAAEMVKQDWQHL